MKNSLNLFAMCIALLFATSCQKVKEVIAEKLMTLEETSETIENILDSAECGLTSDIEDLVAMASENYELLKVDCNYSFDSTFSCSNDGSLRAYDFAVDYGWTVTCDDFNIPQTIDFLSSKNGSYTGPRLERTGTGNATLQLTNISPIPPGTNYTLNGAYHFDGSETLVLRNTSVDITIEMELTNTEITKTTFEIVSGNGTFKLVAEGNQGTSETYEGSIQFLGNGQAEVTINGEVFVVSI